MPEPMPSDPVDETLKKHWPALVAKLGERLPAFVEAVQAKAAARGFEPGLLATRFANLCFALGPSFESRPENEWALAILLEERLKPWVKLHQLVTGAAADLERRGGDGPALAAQLRVSDAAVMDQLDPAGIEPGAVGPRRVRRGETPVPRVACDLEAAEIRLLDVQWRQEYGLDKGQWQRRAAAPVAPVRIDAQHPAPVRITVLTRAEGEAEPARLQVRTVHHGRCGLGIHPSVVWLGGPGPEQWRDEAARAPAWPMQVPRDADPPKLLQEAWHDIGLLEIKVCGVRDSGQPLDSAQVQVWAYWARQSLLTMEREALLGFALPDKPDGSKASPPAVKPTRFSFERDGNKLSAETWQRGFDDSLRPALAEGLQRLLDAWQPHVHDASLRAEFGLFEGKAGLTWGLREGSRGLLSPPVQRVVADLDWSASGDLHLQGRVDYAGARANLHLHVEGVARLQTLVERLQGEAGLLQVMQGAALRWRWPVRLDYDAIADDNGTVFSEVGPCSGALTGSLGLRPSVTGGGGWEWFATMAVEPVATRVVVHDPLLGRSESHMALLGTVSLLDWSLS